MRAMKVMSMLLIWAVLGWVLVSTFFTVYDNMKTLSAIQISQIYDEGVFFVLCVNTALLAAMFGLSEK